MAQPAQHKYMLGITSGCSCGWRGATCFGEGARSEAAKQWHSHRERCEREAG